MPVWADIVLLSEVVVDSVVVVDEGVTVWSGFMVAGDDVVWRVVVVVVPVWALAEKAPAVNKEARTSSVFMEQKVSVERMMVSSGKTAFKVTLTWCHLKS